MITRIVVNDGDIFEGTLEQFEDCFFIIPPGAVRNASLGIIEDWAEDHGFKLHIEMDWNFGDA